MANDYRYLWLNIRGLPVDPAADYAPPAGRVVIGQEWFSASDAISSGSKLDLEDMQISSAAVSIKLADRNTGARSHYLRGLLQSAPQESVLVTAAPSAGVVHVSGADIVDSIPQPLWTALGECVQVTGDTTDDEGRRVYTITRAWNDTEFEAGEDAVLRPGMLLYKYPILSSLFAELWVYDAGTNTETMLYCGILTTVTHDPSGLGITLRISDMITGTTMPRASSLTVADGLIPGCWQLVYSSESVSGQADERPTWLLIPTTTPALYAPSAFSFGPLKLSNFSIKSDDSGNVSLRLTWEADASCTRYGQSAIDHNPRLAGLVQSRTGVELRFRYTDIVDCSAGWTLDTDATVARFTLGVQFPETGNWIEIRYPRGTARAMTFWSPFPLPLVRDPAPDLYSGISELGNLFSSTNGYNEIPQVVQPDATGYWAAWYAAHPTLSPTVRYTTDDAQYEITGVWRATVYGAALGSVSRADGWDIVGYGDVALSRTPIWPGAGTVLTELLPLAGGPAYLVPDTSWAMDLAMTDIITGGRVDTMAAPPFRGLGIPAEYVDLDVPSLNGLSVSGWIEIGKKREILRSYGFGPGTVIGCDTAGKIRIASLLRAPSDGQYIDVPTITVDSLLEPPAVEMVYPSARAVSIEWASGNKLVVNAIDSQADDVVSFEVPDFVAETDAAEFAARLLPLVSKPRMQLSCKVLSGDISSQLVAGGHVRVTGSIPGNPYNADEVDNYALVLEVKRRFFADRLELVLLLLPEYATTYGYHWGSPLEAWDGSAHLWLRREYGADHGTIYPPGIYSDDTAVTLWDSQGQCDDYFEATPSSRESKNGSDCYKLYATYIASTPSVRAIHPVVVAGAGYVEIAGDYRYQWPVGLRCLATGGTVSETVTAVAYYAGTNRTRITAGWASVPTTSDLVWSESITVQTADYSTDSADSQRHYYYDDPANTAIDLAYAPGNRVWEVAGYNAVAKTINIYGDLRPDFPDVSALRPVYLAFSDPAIVNTSTGAPLAVTGVTYSAPYSTLQLTTWTGAAVTVGDTLTDARKGGRLIYVRDGSVHTYYYR